jgi:hypothetical protein
MSKSITLALLILFSALFSSSVSAQCSPSAPAEGVCSGGNGAAYDGVNISNGETYWYSGTATFSNGSNINNGGTLRVCGNLTLSQINLNGGTIIVTSGATLTINGSGQLNLNNNVSIVNYGTLNLNRDVTMQNSGNSIINATASSVINMANYKLKITGSNTSSGNILINKGTINLHTLEITENSAGVCMGNQSVINTKYYVNSKTNAIAVEPGGVAVLRFTQTGQNSAALSATSSLHVCKAPGAIFNGNNVGAATVYDNCTSAAVALPITLSSFQAKASNNTAVLTWETAQEKDNDYFQIEHSTDGIRFETVSEIIPGAGNSDKFNRYTWTDETPDAGIHYYRLKQVDIDGTVHFHGIRSVTIERGNTEVKVFPNPATQQVTIRLSDNNELPTNISVMDLTGRQVLSKMAGEGVASVELDLSSLPSGNYSVAISNERHAQTVKLVKR